MTQHTPSPWDTRKGAYGVLHVGPAMLAHPGREAAQYAAERGRDLLAQREADAALIAAAPDMLAALQALLGVAETIDDDTMGAVLDNARAVIAKANGGAE
jgi:hypothetical protein